jgi:hypothetical protein
MKSVKLAPELYEIHQISPKRDEFHIV